MTRVLIARGPDAEGMWFDDDAGVSFGHRRLAVVDTSTEGTQPMTSADGRWVINFNGEIYNFRELAAELTSAGVRFHSHCDTEVLLEAIARWGLRTTLDRVDGMFAFGIWDRDRRELTLVRDRMGEKPLYYGTLPTGEVAFASTLDALSEHPAFTGAVDLDALGLFFRHSYVPAPWTIYRDFRKLAPSHMVTVTASGVGTPCRYWSLTDVALDGPRFAGTEHDAVERLDELLRRSVARRLVTDVPIGAFLSGGIDSSAIVAIAQQVGEPPTRTFTVGSTNSDFDESADASTVAQHLGTKHTELIVSDSDALAMVHGIATVHDEPFGDSSQLPTRILSEMARESVTVALSGDGGDEMFGGYNRYLWAASIWRSSSRLPVGVRRGFAGAARRIPQWAWDRAAEALPEGRRPQQLGLKISKVLDIADAPTREELFHRLTSDWLDPSSVVPGSRVRETVHTDPSRWPSTDSYVEHMMLIDAETFLPDDVLTKVDRAAMSASLETRLPYLDRDVMSFAVSLPVSLRIRRGVSKWPLRQVLHRYVPEELVDRPKSGFGVPIDQWLRGPLRGWAEELIETSPAMQLLDAGVVRRTWQQHQQERRNNAYLLWDVLMYLDWCNHHPRVDVGSAAAELAHREG